VLGLGDVCLLLSRMIKVSDAFSWEEMCSFTDADMDCLLGYYPKNRVPTMDELRSAQGLSEKKLDLFDGSFGFSVGA
jgi:precorrin-2 dehydrogenase / sirohydrochlorin ferrochelatase